MKQITLLILVLIVAPTYLTAGYIMGDKKPVASDKKKTIKHKKFPDASKTEETDETPVLQDLSEKFNQPMERLQYYRTLKHGYEEIVPALIVAREGQVEPGRVLKLRMDGKSWADISKELFIELKPLNKEVNEVLKPIRKQVSKKALTERPETRGE